MFIIGLAADSISNVTLLDIQDALDRLSAADKRSLQHHDDMDFIAFDFSNELAAERFRDRFDAVRLPNVNGEWWNDFA